MARNSRLKAARVLEDLTQLELAEAIGVPEIQVSRWETGRATPDRETKQLIAEVLGKPTYELFDC